MAFSYSFTLLPLSLLVAASLISVAAADQALINSICSRTSNQTLCHQILNHSVSADRAGLGQIAVDAALQNIHYSQNLIGKLDQEKAYNQTKDQYDTCLSSYDFALSSLKDSKLFFGKHDFAGALDQALMALTSVDSCLDNAPSAPPELTAAVHEYEAYLCILLVIANVDGNI